MVNPFDYLYYKIYAVLSFISGGVNPINHISAFTILLILNILTIYRLIAGSLSNEFIIGTGIVVLLFVSIYFGVKKEKHIIEKYENESEDSRMLGNILVTLYVLLSVVSFILAVKH